jgi:nickel-dependent lactate racemase
MKSMPKGLAVPRTATPHQIENWQFTGREPAEDWQRTGRKAVEDDREIGRRDTVNDQGKVTLLSRRVKINNITQHKVTTCAYNFIKIKPYTSRNPDNVRRMDILPKGKLKRKERADA